MTAQHSRYAGPDATLADGWELKRITPVSRLSGANGIRTGADGRIYVAQVAGSCVSALHPDSGEIETISQNGGGIVAPDDLVFDDAGNLYCTEITKGRVSMLAPDGSTRIIADDMPVANPITFHQGRLIAGELRMGGRILELDRNGGGGHRVIYDQCPMVNAFDVGPDGKLYFPAQAANEIWRISLDGGEPEVVAKDLGVPDSVKFHPDGYIVSTQVFSGQVLKIDPQTGAQEVLANIGPGLDNVTFVGKRIFVSHITGTVQEIVSPGVAKPLIDRGFQWPLGLGVDGDTVCIADGMFAYTVKPGEKVDMAGTLFGMGYPGFMRGVAIAKPGEWVVTTAVGTVASWRPAEQTHDILASGLDIPMGVAVTSGGAVIAADYGSGRIVSIENANITDIATGIDRPTGVAVASDDAVYVSTGAGTVVKLAGGRSETILDALGEPQGIVISGGKLYVIDIASKTLIESDLAGGARREIATNLPVGAPAGIIPHKLGGVGDMCGPMFNFTGLAAGSDGTLYISGDGEGSVLSLKPL